MTGTTLGDLDGSNAGSYDAFLSKYTSDGTLAWTCQRGTSSSDRSYSVATDTFGNLFIAGSTGSSLGGPSVGGFDSFLSKYSSNGTFLWTHQIGTSSRDEGYGASTDAAGNVLVSGRTQGAFNGSNESGWDVFVAKLAVPEPGTAALLVVGALPYLVSRRR